MHTSTSTTRRASGLRARKRALLAAAAVAAAAAAAPHAASAAVVSTANGTLTYQAQAGEINQPIPFTENGVVKLREANPATPLLAGQGCQIVSDRLAECPNVVRVSVDLGDKNDTYYGTGAGFFPVFVNGGSGNDLLMDGAGTTHKEVYFGGADVDTVSYQLAGTPVSLTLDNATNDGESGEGDFISDDVENLTGGAGRDVLVGNRLANSITGGPGNDNLFGQEGNDVFNEGSAPSGADSISGGSDEDRVRYVERTAQGVSVSLDGQPNDGAAGESDNVQSDVEDITGTPLADHLTGSSLANTIAGIGGNDTIDPLGGADTVFGGDDNDTINVIDGVADVARGNSGTDTIRHDAQDDAIA